MRTGIGAAVDDSTGCSRMLVGVRAMLGTALAVTASTVIAVALAEGSFASWVSASTVTPGVVNTGSADLDVDAAFTAASWSNLLVGESVRQPLTITNLGDVPLALTASGTTGSPFYELRMSAGACPASAISGVSLAASTRSLGTLAAGSTVAGCLEVRLVAGAAAGSTSAVTATVSGEQAG